jgi:hypothetical protein
MYTMIMNQQNNKSQAMVFLCDFGYSFATNTRRHTMLCIGICTFTTACVMRFATLLRTAHATATCRTAQLMIGCVRVTQHFCNQHEPHRVQITTGCFTGFVTVVRSCLRRLLASVKLKVSETSCCLGLAAGMIGLLCAVANCYYLLSGCVVPSLIVCDVLPKFSGLFAVSFGQSSWKSFGSLEFAPYDLVISPALQNKLASNTKHRSWNANY